MNDSAPTGLRPIARRLEGGGNLSSQTRRITMPPVEKKKLSETGLQEVKIATPVIAPPTIAQVKHFFIVPCVDPHLMEVFPRGVRLSSEWLYIGRNPHAEIGAFLALVLNREGVSKMHAAVTVHMGKAFVGDLGSSNGTFIIRDQQMIEVGKDLMELHHNDLLGLGPILFRVISQ